MVCVDSRQTGRSIGAPESVVLAFPPRFARRRAVNGGTLDHTVASRRHHYVPQGYLRGFATDEEHSGNFVWVYDKRPGRAPRMKSVRSIAWEDAYYAQEKPDGTEDTETVESSLAQTIDNEIPRILRGIRPNVGDSVELSAADKAALAFFVGISMTRVPSFRDGINDLHTRIAEIGLSHQMEADPQLKALGERYGVTISAKPWVSLRPMVQLAQAIAQSALSKPWQFFVPPPNVPLVTSDNPVIFSGGAERLKDYIGPAHPLVELVINLRKDLALVCTPKQGYGSMRVFQLTPAEARKFNRAPVRAARHRVFASHHSDVFEAFVKKYVGEEQRIVV